MSSQLKANSLSFFESLVMGVAGSAPGYTIAVTTAVLIATVGHLAPGALLIFSVPMLGIAVAYKALSKHDVNAGAAYRWTTEVCGRFWGYFSGWALLVASMVFMVTGSIRLPPRRWISSIRLLPAMSWSRRRSPAAGFWPWRRF